MDAYSSERVKVRWRFCSQARLPGYQLVRLFVCLMLHNVCLHISSQEAASVARRRGPVPFAAEIISILTTP